MLNGLWIKLMSFAMSCIPVWHCPTCMTLPRFEAFSATGHVMAMRGDFSWYPSSSQTTAEMGAQDLPVQSSAVTLGSWKKELALKGKHETFNTKWEVSDCVWPLDGILVQRRDRLGLCSLFPYCCQTNARSPQTLSFWEIILISSTEKGQDF